jgi:cobalt-zinc-cadmium efflux system protein
VGVAVNVVVTWQLARAERRSLNVRGSYQHILTDFYAFIGTAVAEVAAAMRAHPGVANVHDLPV